MSEISTGKDPAEIKPHHPLDPALNTLTPRHTRIYLRYQTARIMIDFSAAVCFVIGSALFLFSDTIAAASRLFLAGSLFFAVKPTIDLVKAFHLSKL